MKPALYQDLFPTHADFLYRNAFLIMKLSKASKFQSDLSSNCFTIDVWKIKCWLQHFISRYPIYLDQVPETNASILRSANHMRITVVHTAINPILTVLMPCVNNNKILFTSTRSQKQMRPSSDPLTTCVSLWFMLLSTLYWLFLCPVYSPSSSPESLSNSLSVLSSEDVSMHWPSLVKVTYVTGSTVGKKQNYTN